MKSLDVKDNRVILGREDELYSSHVYVNQVNWITPKLVKPQMKIKAKIRYRQKEQIANLTVLDHNRVKLEFDESKEQLPQARQQYFI